MTEINARLIASLRKMIAAIELTDEEGLVGYADDVIEAKAILAEAERMTAWRPIAEAPRDGTRVLLFPHMLTAQWDFGAEDWLVLIIPLNDDHTIGGWTAPISLFYEFCIGQTEIEPTHWQPLLEPPSVSTPTKGE